MKRWWRMRSTDSRSLAMLIATAFGLTCFLAETQLVYAQQQYTVLYSFTGGSDGGIPEGGVIKDEAGNLYGTTLFGGTFGDGTVFRLYQHQESVLHNFSGPLDGRQPGALVADDAGNLYGTTSSGGANCCGTVFKLDPQGKVTVLYNFTDGADGGFPLGSLVRDAAGNLYGTTFQGGSTGFGTIFKVDTAGHETVLHSFTASGGDGAFPYSGLLAGAEGKFYGTTFGGGVFGYGTVFRIDDTGITILYSFTGGADGANPVARVIRDDAGNLYGTTLRGGDQSVMCNGYVGCGTVFELTHSGTEIVLYSFTGGNDGANPFASLARDSAGNLYGTTQFGGSSPCSGLGCGTVFKLGASGNEVVLHEFTGGADGANPQNGLLRDEESFYGVTPLGGAYNGGTLFKIVPTGTQDE